MDLNNFACSNVAVEEKSFAFGRQSSMAAMTKKECCLIPQCFVGDAAGEISGLINIVLEVFYLSAQTIEMQVFQCYVYRLIFQVYSFLFIQGDVLLVVLGRLLSYSAERVFQCCPQFGHYLSRSSGVQHQKCQLFKFYLPSLSQFLTPSEHIVRSLWDFFFPKPMANFSNLFKNMYD